MLREDVDGSAHQRPVTSYPVYVMVLSVCRWISQLSFSLRACVRVVYPRAQQMLIVRKETSIFVHACVWLMVGLCVSVRCVSSSS